MVSLDRLWLCYARRRAKDCTERRKPRTKGVRVLQQSHPPRREFVKKHRHR